MSKGRTRLGSRLGLGLGVALLVTACGADTQITAPFAEPEEELREILFEAIQDEYHAEATYEGVLEDFGEVAPFSNIVNAEVRHSSAIATLYVNRGWTVPVSQWSASNVPEFGSIAEACAAGVAGELANVAVYDHLLGEAGLPDDFIRVFESNRAASLERHLPAFQLCSS